MSTKAVVYTPRRHYCPDLVLPQIAGMMSPVETVKWLHMVDIL